MNLFDQTEKAALWDLIESRRISLTPVGFGTEDGFRATVWIDVDEDTIDTKEAKGATAKEAVEKLIKELEEQ